MGVTMAASAEPTTVGFELRANLIVVRATVNGVEAPMLLDTGAGGTTISPRLRERLALEEVDRDVVRGAGGPVLVSRIGLESLALGGSAVANLTATAMPLTDVSMVLGDDLDGIIGFDFLSKFRVTIDYRARSLTLNPYDREVAGATIDGDVLRHESPAFEVTRLEGWEFRTETPLPAIHAIVAHAETGAEVRVQSQELHGLGLERLSGLLMNGLSVQVEGLVMLGERARKLAGIEAVSIDYAGTVDGRAWRARMIAGATDERAWIIEAGAPPEAFDAMAPDMEAIVKSLRFAAR